MAKLNGCSTLAQRFSQIDNKMVQEEIRQGAENQEKLARGIKSIIKHSDLPEKILALFPGDSKMTANRHLQS
jgi:hypothetical protein